MSWSNNFFSRQSAGKAASNYASKFNKINEGIVDSYDFNYFDVTSGKLEKNEIRSNNNLLNPNEFAKYWQTGKHQNYLIFNGDDIDGDKVNDMIAVNPAGQVVGFNERYIVPAGETPYKRAYYAQDKDKRAKQSYQQFLETQSNIPEWKKLDKFKENRSKALHKVIATYLAQELNAVGASSKEIEIISKRLIDLISSTFFAADVPSYQIKVIKGAPEFKKVLNENVNLETLPTYLPEGEKANIAQGMLMSIRGYYDGGLQTQLKAYLDQIPGNRLDKDAAHQLYTQLLAKSAANKLYKEFGITPMYLVEHPEQATKFQTAVKNRMTELDAKNQMEEIKAFNASG